MTKTIDRSHEGWCIFLSSRSHFKANWISKISWWMTFSHCILCLPFGRFNFSSQRGWNNSNPHQLDGALVMGRQHILSETSLWIGLWIIMIQFKRYQLIWLGILQLNHAKKPPFYGCLNQNTVDLFDSIFFPCIDFPSYRFTQVSQSLNSTMFYTIISKVKQPVGWFLLKRIFFLWRLESLNNWVVWPICPSPHQKQHI